MEIGAQVNLWEVVQASVAIAGFAVIWFQIRLLVRNLRSVTQDNLYTHYVQVGKCFLDQPHLLPYFYKNKMFKPDPNNPHLREEIDLMSEAMLSLIEHAAVQENNLPEDTWEHCWRAYARERLQKSVEMRKFYKPNRWWFARALQGVVDPLMKEINKQPMPCEPDAHYAVPPAGNAAETRRAQGRTAQPLKSARLSSGAGRPARAPSRATSRKPPRARPTPSANGAG